MAQLRNNLRVLLVQTAFLGDVVLTLPLINTLQHHMPQARIDVLTVPAHAPLLQGQPGVHAVIPYDKRGRQRGYQGLVCMVRQLRAQQYDLALAPHRSWRTALLLARSGIPQRIGFDHWSTRWAYTATVPRPMTGHEVERNLRLLTAVGLAGESVLLPFWVAPAARERARQYYATQGIAATETVIGVIPGSQWGTKRWPAERFTALIEQLSRLWQARFVLFGGPQDTVIAQTITAACPVTVLDLIGRTPVAELAAYLERCDFVISNDTGPMHIAAALGKPIVVLFGPTTAALGFSPYGVLWQEASVALDCRPCHAHGPQRCPLLHWRCMLDLSVEQVVARVQCLRSQVMSRG